MIKRTFEADLARLQEITSILESKDTDLDAALKLYKEAAEIVSACNTRLDEAQLKIEEIQASMEKSTEEINELS